MKKLKLTELNKNERLEKEALRCIRGGSAEVSCCGSTPSDFRKNKRKDNQQSLM